MALFSKSKIFLYGGVRQEKPLTTTHYSHDQLILYHLESFNELLKRTVFSPRLAVPRRALPLALADRTRTTAYARARTVDSKGKKKKKERSGSSRRDKSSSTAAKLKSIMKAKNAPPSQRLARSYTIGDAGTSFRADTTHARTRHTTHDTRTRLIDVVLCVQALECRTTCRGCCTSISTTTGRAWPRTTSLSRRSSVRGTSVLLLLALLHRPPALVVARSSAIVC
jgi:hypothetical protein